MQPGCRSFLEMHLQISPFGVIPKSQPGKWMLTLDLSSPDNFSVNNGIDSSLCSLRYLTMDHIVAAIIQCGRGQECFLCKTAPAQFLEKLSAADFMFDFVDLLRWLKPLENNLCIPSVRVDPQCLLPSHELQGSCDKWKLGRESNGFLGGTYLQFHKLFYARGEASLLKGGSVNK